MAIMEIVKKTDDFENNTSKIDLLDTTFRSLGKVIGSDPGKDWKTFSSGDILSKEGLISLNDEQSSFVPRFENFKDDHNAWVQANTDKGVSEINYSINVEDWAIRYNVDISNPSNSTPASYQQVLTDIANAEKQLYETTYDHTEQLYKSNQEVLKNWSKARPYTNCIETFISAEYRTSTSKFKWNNNGITTSVTGVAAVWEGEGERSRNRFKVSGLTNLSLGQSVNIKGSASYTTIGSPDNPGGITYSCDCKWTIKRTPLGVTFDDGKIEHISHDITGSSSEGVYGTQTYIYNGNSSPHFESEDLNLPWFKTRVFL